MKTSTRCILGFVLFLFLLHPGRAVAATDLPVSESVLNTVFQGKNGSFVLMDCDSDAMIEHTPASAAQLYGPCSTFKIWNGLIGLETGIVSDVNAPFYKWDGKVRSIKAWNKDLTFKEAFQASCVPAFQALARTIGPSRMQLWLDKLDYGDKDISAGIDVFWLPRPDRKTLLISAREQAECIRRLVLGDVPFSAASVQGIKEAMRIKETGKGTLYAKTGSGGDGKGNYNLGWFVGFVESNGKRYAFACNVTGNGMMSSNARTMVETILQQAGML